MFGLIMSALFLRLVSSKKLGLRRVVAYLRRVAESAELPGVPRPVEYAVTLGNSDGDVVRPVVVAVVVANVQLRRPAGWRLLRHVL